MSRAEPEGEGEGQQHLGGETGQPDPARRRVGGRRRSRIVAAHAVSPPVTAAKPAGCLRMGTRELYCGPDGRHNFGRGILVRRSARQPLAAR